MHVQQCNVNIILSSYLDIQAPNLDICVRKLNCHLTRIHNGFSFLINPRLFFNFFKLENIYLADYTLRRQIYRRFRCRLSLWNLTRPLRGILCPSIPIA